MSEFLVRELEKNAVDLALPRGSVLFRSGDPASFVYLVRTGRIALRWTLDGNLFPLATAGPGQIIGLPAALNGVYSATARAVEETQLRAVAVEVVNDLLDCSPQLCRAAMELIAGEVRRMRSMINTISFGESPDPADHIS